MSTITVKDSTGADQTIEKPLAPGRAAAASSKPMVLSTEDKAALDLVATAANQTAQTPLLGAVAETAPATDTASSGLNGRLQRIAQRLTSLLGVLPSSLGAKTGANSLSIVHASDDPLLALAQGNTPSNVVLDTAAISNGGTALTPKFAAISASTSGNNTLVAAVTSKKIRVLAVYLTANGTVNAKFQSGASGTDLTGLAYEVANSGLVLPFNPVGWFETASNTLLNLNLSAAIAVGGSIVYVEV